MRHLLPYLVPVLALSACRDDSKGPSASDRGFVGDGSGPGFSAPGTAGGDGTQGGDGGTGDLGCQVPIGSYAYRSTADGGSDCSQFGLPDPTVVYAQEHAFVPPGVAVGSCTISKTELTVDGCTFRQAIACSDGSNANVTCMVGAAGASLECEGAASAGARSCMTSFVGTRQQSFSCSAPVGVYAIEIAAQGGDAPGCPQSSVRESGLVVFLDGLLSARPSCSWNAPAFDTDSCAFTRRGVCDDVASQPSVTCAFSNDATTGQCDVDDGSCRLTLTLAR